MASPVASNPCPLRPIAGPPQRTELRGPNSEALSRKAAMVTPRILTPDSCLLTPDHQEMKVHPAMFMKTHGRRNYRSRESEIKIEVRSPPCGPEPSDGGLRPEVGKPAPFVPRILAPDSCTSKNEGSSGYVDENTEKAKNRDHQKGEYFGRPSREVENRRRRFRGFWLPAPVFWLPSFRRSYEHNSARIQPTMTR